MLPPQLGAVQQETSRDRQSQQPVSVQLFIHGGGSRTRSSMQQFAEMAGGDDTRLVVVPTATSDSNLPSLEEENKYWKRFGIENVAILHSRDRSDANDPEFLSLLNKATAIWFGGGNQSRLSSAYQGTQFERLLRQRLKAGTIVVGGASAGAATQSRVMITGGREVPDIGLGFDLLPNAIIDQHFLARSRLNRLIRAVRNHPTRTGVGIDESTALVVEGDQATVFGDGYVVLVRQLGDRVDFRSFGDGDTFALSDFGLLSRSIPRALVGIRGSSNLFTDQEELDRWLQKSCVEAEKFRQSYLIEDEFEAKSETLERLITKFGDAHREITNRDPHSLAVFEISKGLVGDGFSGVNRTLNGKRIYGPFRGKWFGRWAELSVEHHWSELVEPVEEFVYGTSKAFAQSISEKLSSDFRRTLQSYQYAWIGDGYGFNLVAQEATADGDKKNYLLGYVEHLNNGDFQNVTARRPHVGIDAGDGKIIWVTAKEVFFEQTFPDELGNQLDSYSIVGFRYSVLNNEFVVKEGFQTMYKRDPAQADRRHKGLFKTFEIPLIERRLKSK